MKLAAFFRNVCLALAPVWLCVATAGQGLQVDVEEFKRLQGEVADLRDANASYQKRIGELTRRIEKLQEDVRASNEKATLKMGDLVTREEMKKVIDRIAEVDEKRESDRKVILEQFDKLEKTLMAALAGNGGGRSSGARSGRNSDREREKEPDRDAKAETIEGVFFPHKVKPDETLSEIIQLFNKTLQADGRPTIGLSAVRKANPNLDLDRIYVGQTIQLPVPDKK